MEEAVIEAGKFVGAGFMFGLAAIGAGVGAGVLSSKLICLLYTSDAADD